MHSVGLLDVKRSTDPACQSPTSAPVERGPLTVSHHAEPPAPRPPAQWRGVRRALLPPEGLPRRQVEATAAGHPAPIAGMHWHRSDPVLPGALGSTQPRHTSVGTSNGSPAPGAPGATKPKTQPARSQVPFGSIPLPEPSPHFCTSASALGPTRFNTAACRLRRPQTLHAGLGGSARRRLVREEWVEHERGALAQFLTRCDRGSPVAVEQGARHGRPLRKRPAATDAHHRRDGGVGGAAGVLTRHEGSLMVHDQTVGQGQSPHRGALPFPFGEGDRP